MKSKITEITFVTLLILSLTLSLVSAMDPSGASPNQINPADNSYDTKIVPMTAWEKLLQSLNLGFDIIACDPNKVGCTTNQQTVYHPGDTIKFAASPELDKACNWGYIILEVYQGTDSNGKGGNLVSSVKDDGHSNLKAGDLPSSYITYSLPSSAKVGNWDVITFFACGDTLRSDVTSYQFSVQSSGVSSCTKNVVGDSCFDGKVLESYLDTDCTTKYFTKEICPSTSVYTQSSCVSGTCVTSETSCTDPSINGHICSNGKTCNGDYLNTKESNCCSVACSDVLECYADSDCGTGEYCTSTDNTCQIKKVTMPNTTTSADNFVCCYNKEGGLLSPEVSYVKESEFQDKCYMRARKILCDGLSIGDNKSKVISSGEITSGSTSTGGSSTSTGGSGTSSLSTPIGISRLSSATDSMLKAAQCSTDIDCSGKEGYKVTCRSSEDVKTAYPQYAEQLGSAFGVGTVEGLCVYDDTSSSSSPLLDIFKGLGNTTLFLIIGGVLLFIVVALFKK